MIDINTRGATAEDWFHLDFVLGLGENLLPCVPYGEDVKVLSGSALSGKLGKIPGQFNRNGEAHGIPGWQKREILSNELQLWQADRRLNLCVRTGPISGVYAFDIDIEDRVIASDIHSVLLNELCQNFAHAVCWRERDNSGKFLIPFRMDAPCKKRKIKLDNSPKGPAIELLADGQQFVACGSHSSGVRYQWTPSLPDQLPTLTLDQMSQIWATLTKTYATTESAKDNRIAQVGAATTTPSTKATSSASLPASPDSNTVLTSCSEDDWSQLLSALRFLAPYAGDEDLWARIGMALLSIKDCGKPVRQLWLDFSKKAPGWEDGAPEQWWEAHARG